MTTLPQAPRYGRASTADLTPSLLAALGVGTFEDVLGLGVARRACLLLIDGLGFHQLREHTELAPRLAAATRTEPIDAACPTTTVANLGSIGTGRTPGEHGMLGATVALPDQDRPMSLLQWKLAGVGPKVPLVDREPPERVQPLPTILQSAAGAGLEPVTVGPREHAGSGLNRAVLRGATHVGADSPAELATTVPAVLAERDRRFVYAYHGPLDLAGHTQGIDSDGWREELSAVDRLVADLSSRMPADALLVVTADHGMVDLDREDLVDVADVPALLDGVRVVAGEPRLRHVHARPDADPRDVLAAWRDALADRCWVVSREEAVEEGWFGPVSERSRQRVGDVVVAAREPIGIVQRDVDPRQRELVGHHGSLTDAELHVPLAVIRRAGLSG